MCIRDSNMATTRLMPLHTGKGRTVGQAISLSLIHIYAAMLVVPNCAIFVSIISRSCDVTRNLS